MRVRMLFVGILSLMLLSGCTAYFVNPVAYDPNFKEVYVIEDFPPVTNLRLLGANGGGATRARTKSLFAEIQDEFRKRGIKARCVTREMAERKPIPADAYVLKYDSAMNWDFGWYLDRVEMELTKGHITRGWCFGLWRNLFTKYGSDSGKMKEFFKEFMRNY